MTDKVKLFKAIAGFQQEAPVLLRDTDGYGYKYVTFDHIVAQIKPLLKKYNLGFSQIVEGRGLTTIIFHTESGESIEGTAEIPDIDLKSLNKYQSFGAGITYYRRYALTSMLGLLSDKDIDADIYKVLEKEVVTETEVNPEAKKFELNLSKESTPDNNVINVLRFISDNKELGLKEIVKILNQKYKMKAFDQNNKQVQLTTIVKNNLNDKS